MIIVIRGVWMKKVLFTATVDSHIIHFHIPYLQWFKEQGYEVHVACNFKKGNSCPVDKVNELTMKLNELNVKYFQIDFDRNYIWKKKKKANFVPIVIIQG